MYKVCEYFVLLRVYGWIVSDFVFLGIFLPWLCCHKCYIMHLYIIYNVKFMSFVFFSFSVNTATKQNFLCIYLCVCAHTGAINVCRCTQRPEVNSNSTIPQLHPLFKCLRQLLTPLEQLGLAGWPPSPSNLPVSPTPPYTLVLRIQFKYLKT